MRQTDVDRSIKARFAKARKQYPHTKEMVYFNCAANSPFSSEIEKSVSHYVKRRIREGGDAHDTMHLTADELRRMFASLTGVSKAEIGLCSQTTYGLNLAAFGLPLKRGDEVLLSDIEFPAAVYTWRAAAQARGLKIGFVQSVNHRFDIEQFEKSITKRTRVLCLSWIQFFNGYKNDLKAIGKICQSHGIYFVVDGIQGMGVEPINLKQLGVDIFTAGSQKWLLSGQGGGFFYIGRALQDEMTPPLASWMDVDWKGNYTDLFHYDKPAVKSARRFEMGYYNVLNIVSLFPPLKLISDLGLREIQSHNYALIDQLAEYIDNSDFYRITSLMEKKRRSSIFTFTADNLTGAYEELLRSKVVVACREGSIRVSVHCYNNESDIRRIIQVLDSYAGSQ